MQTNNALVWFEKTLADFPELGIALYVRSATSYSGPNAGDAHSLLSSESSELSRSFGALLKGRFAGVVTVRGEMSRRRFHRDLCAV